MPGSALRLDDQMPRSPIGVENPKVVARVGLAFVQHKPDVQIPKLLGSRELGDAVQAADLLVGDEGQVDGADWDNVGGFQVSDGLEVLDGDALVVLGPTGEYAAVCGAVGGEGGVGPLVWLGGDGVEVGVEEEGGEGGAGARPGEEEEGLGFRRREVEGLDLEV